MLASIKEGVMKVAELVVVEPVDEVEVEVVAFWEVVPPVVSPPPVVEEVPEVVEATAEV
jgi:hypothetical protein